MPYLPGYLTLLTHMSLSSAIPLPPTLSHFCHAFLPGSPLPPTDISVTKTCRARETFPNQANLGFSIGQIGPTHNFDSDNECVMYIPVAL